MKRETAETSIRRAMREWADKTGAKGTAGRPADFYAFKRWAEQNGYAVYLNSPDNMTELWFDQELGQMDWR